jgi:predicted DCC family thiol-disulfide oxidoreductase YuxK
MDKGAIILFDGVCNLCNGAVQFVIKRDRRNYFKFAALQSDFAQKKIASFNLTAVHGNSILLLENGKVYQQSTAALRIAKKLNGLWPMFYAFVIIPPFIRNAVYRLVARNRYRWFGRQEACWVPTPALKHKFLE